MRRNSFPFTEQFKLGLALIFICFFLIFTDALWPWDQKFYDIQMRTWSKPTPDDIIIVAIDEASLHQLGRWPWSRGIHANLINQLSKMGAKTVVMDIIIAEPNQNDPAGDNQLAEAIRNSGKVILPVLIEQNRLGGQLKETLPIPGLIQAGANMGHIHIELDQDGIARSIYLYQGLSTPLWPHISLAAYQLNHLQTPNRSQNISPPRQSIQHMDIQRMERRLIPFLGPPGHFPRLSYKDVLSGNVDEKLIQNKVIFIGATATGLGDALPTPLSGKMQPMPGIEINANIYSALIQGNNYQQIDIYWQIFISVSFILLTIILFPKISARHALLLSTALLVTVLLSSFLLLHFAHRWLPPLAIILPLLLSYPLWSWRRLEFTASHLQQQLDLLNNEPNILSSKRSIHWKTQLQFFCELFSFQGWAIYRDHQPYESSFNDTSTSIDIESINKQTVSQKWQTTDCGLVLTIDDESQLFNLLLMFKQNERIDEDIIDFLNNFAISIYNTPKQSKNNTIEIIEQQVLQVKFLNEKMTELRKFITISLEQMADTVIVTSGGSVTLFNRQASLLFGNQNCINANLLHLLSSCQLTNNQNWKSILLESLLFKKSTHSQVKHSSGKFFLVQIVPLNISGEQDVSLICNFSDITKIKTEEIKRIEYINFLSHDLRSPLNSTLALLEIDQTTINNKTRQTNERLRQYTERALSLTENFVQLARADNIDVIDFSEIDLLQIIYNATDQLWSQSHKKNITIKINTVLENAISCGDAPLLERVITNLLDNAIKFSPEGSTITTTLSKLDNRFLCKISDQGIGISKNNLPFLFDRYHRVKSNNQQHTGVGLGLAFVSAVIESHKGEIGVNSTQGTGSTFWFIMPKSK